MSKKAIIFGAGRIGQGFLAQLATGAGGEAVSTLNERKAYTIRLVGDTARDVELRNLKAIHGT